MEKCTGCGEENPITYRSRTEDIALCRNCICQTGPCLLPPGHPGPHDSDPPDPPDNQRSGLLSVKHRVAGIGANSVVVAAHRGNAMASLRVYEGDQLLTVFLNKQQLRRLQASLREAEEVL